MEGISQPGDLVDIQPCGGKIITKAQAQFISLNKDSDCRVSQSCH